ncbi:MAG: site-specific DNA-methyltransferase [Spirochaetales bacterium]|nr:site-specific DNA-methyltransferase [Spirochaetales bacterium]
MPTLQFKGKASVWNHHLAIPYHTLEEVRDLDFQPGKGDGNLIVEGDNLLALKALLPQYAGKVQCIYIDPPYNTGNEGWVYNDNVNSPLIRQWLGREVGTDDLTRHDKWLCMMVPRLKLLRELLADDGAIFVSIDDNEVHRLREMMDEVFGEDQWTATFIWEKRTTRENRRVFSFNHDYIVLCAPNRDLFEARRGLLPLTEEVEARYGNPDSDPRGPWQSVSLNAQAGHATEDQFYRIKTPGGRTLDPPPGRCWTVTEKRLKELIADNRVWFGQDGTNVPRLKKFRSEAKEGLTPHTLWTAAEVGTTDSAKKALLQLFDQELPFEAVKPVELLLHILRIGTDLDSIILDSFAGSGTTMHAVMELNGEDGGSRKCILVQMTEATEKEPEKNISRDITRERVKRAIEKNGYNSGFRYLRVGKAIDAQTMLAGELPTYTELAKHVYYLRTGAYHPDANQVSETDYFVGGTEREALFLIYKNDYDALTRLALTLELAEKFRSAHEAKRYVVYAPACYLDQESLADMKIDFVLIPYELHRRG